MIFHHDKGRGSGEGMDSLIVGMPSCLWLLAKSFGCFECGAVQDVGDELRLTS